ncbi:hypothetical protein JW905_09800 [bacterium]|nr:hypothetical protein [candidate division CSSED10-310 bacterium]
MMSCKSVLLMMSAALLLVPFMTVHAEPLTTEDLLLLHAAGVGEEVIRAQADSAGLAGEFTTADLLRLKEAGFSDALMEFMVKRAAAGSDGEPVVKPAAESAPPASSADPAQCRYLEGLQAINDKYEAATRINMDILKSSLDGSIVESMIRDRVAELEDIRKLEVPIQVMGFHDRVIRFMEREITLYRLLNRALHSDTEVLGEARTLAFQLLADGKEMYQEHNRLRGQCGMTPLPALSVLNL